MYSGGLAEGGAVEGVGSRKSGAMIVAATGLQFVVGWWRRRQHVIKRQVIGPSN